MTAESSMSSNFVPRFGYVAMALVALVLIALGLPVLGISTVPGIAPSANAPEIDVANAELVSMTVNGQALNFVTDADMAANQNLAIIINRARSLVPVHGLDKHGIEFKLAFRCLQQYGSEKQWRTFGMTGFDGKPLNTILYMCLDKWNKQRYAAVIHTDEAGKLWAITAYKIDDKFKTISAFFGYLYEKWDAEVYPIAIKAGEAICNFNLK